MNLKSYSLGVFMPSIHASIGMHRPVPETAPTDPLFLVPAFPSQVVGRRRYKVGFLSEFVKIDSIHVFYLNHTYFCTYKYCAENIRLFALG
jgi:hypothetical protein